MPDVSRETLLPTYFILFTCQCGIAVSRETFIAYGSAPKPFGQKGIIVLWAKS